MVIVQDFKLCRLYSTQYLMVHSLIVLHSNQKFSMLLEPNKQWGLTYSILNYSLFLNIFSSWLRLCIHGVLYLYKARFHINYNHISIAGSWKYILLSSNFFCIICTPYVRNPYILEHSCHNTDPKILICRNQKCTLHNDAANHIFLLISPLSDPF